MASPSGFFRGDDGRIRAPWRILIIVLPAIVAVQLVGIGAEVLLGEPWSFVVAGLLMAAAALAVVTPLARRVDRRPLRGYGLRVDGRWWRDFGAGLGLGLAIPAIAFAVLLVTGQARVAGTFSPGAEVTLWAAAAPVLVYWSAVAFWEELVFRGAMLKNAAEGLAGRMSRTGAVAAAPALTTLIFAAGHANQFVDAGAPPALAVLLWVALGVVLGLAYVLTGSLAAPIGIHLTVNLGIINIFGLTGERGADAPTVFRLELTGTDLVAGPGGVISLLAAVAGIGLVVVWAALRGRAAEGVRLVAEPPRRLRGASPVRGRPAGPAAAPAGGGPSAMSYVRENGADAPRFSGCRVRSGSSPSPPRSTAPAFTSVLPRCSRRSRGTCR